MRSRPANAQELGLDEEVDITSHGPVPLLSRRCETIHPTCIFIIMGDSSPTGFSETVYGIVPVPTVCDQDLVRDNVRALQLSRVLLPPWSYAHGHQCVVQLLRQELLITHSLLLKTVTKISLWYTAHT